MKNRKWYPPNWHELALACKQAANWHCEDCGMHIPQEGIEYINRKGKKCIMYLEASHDNHDTLSLNPVLKARCRSCHAKYDNRKDQKKKRVSYEVWRHQLMLEAKGIVPATKRNRSKQCITSINEKNTSKMKLRNTA